MQSSVNEAKNDAAERIPLLENGGQGDGIEAMESEEIAGQAHCIDVSRKGRAYSDQREKKCCRSRRVGLTRFAAPRLFEEAEIYIKAGLKEVAINGKSCLVRQDIDLEAQAVVVPATERMINGQPP